VKQLTNAEMKTLTEALKVLHTHWPGRVWHVVLGPTVQGSERLDFFTPLTINEVPVAAVRDPRKGLQEVPASSP
jgi:hypothetical protein